MYAVEKQAVTAAEAWIRLRWIVRYPEPAVEVDLLFAAYNLGSAVVELLATGARWTEGPVWFGDGRYLLWSDIPNDRIQLRWLQEDRRVSTLRKPANHSNGNTFDRQGRQISCEHGTRRVVRYEPTAASPCSPTSGGQALQRTERRRRASRWSVWFTDPGYGLLGNFEGHKGELLLKEAVYRIDPSGKIEMVTDEIFKPNGLCFSPDECCSTWSTTA